MKTKLKLAIGCVLFFCSQTFSQLPTCSWALGTSSNGNVFNNSITTDRNGNVLATGSFMTSSMVLGSYTLPNNYPLTETLFVTKLDAAGNVLWATSASSGSRGVSIIADEGNNVVVTGIFYGNYMTIGAITLTSTANNAFNMFVVKYDPAGNILWAKTAICQDVIWGNGVAADAAGNLFVTGYYKNSSITFGNFTLPVAGDSRMFLVKYDTQGNTLWAKTSSGSNEDWAMSVATDINGNVVVAGNFDDPAITFGNTTLVNTNGTVPYSDAFIVKYDTQGNVLWAHSTNGSLDDESYSVAIDKNNNVIVTGYFDSYTLTFDLASVNRVSGRNMFVVKYDASGTVQWAVSGSSSNTSGTGVATDAAGNIFATGDYYGAITLGTAFFPSSGDYDFYIAKYSPAGALLWVKNAIGTGADFCNSVTSDGGTNVYATGVYYISTIAFGNTSLYNPVNGDAQTYIAKLDLSTGIETVTDPGTFILYPNPGNGTFTIKNNNITSVEIFAVSGKKITQKFLANRV